MSDMQTKWTVSIIWPPHTGAGVAFDAHERYEHCTAVSTEGSKLSFRDEFRLEHETTLPFSIIEECR